MDLCIYAKFKCAEMHMLCENVQSIMIYIKNKLHLDEEK